jgi:hypothetical protein
METILFGLALFGIVAGVYTLFLPSLRKRGWSLPFMNLVADDADEDDDLEQFEHYSEPKGRRGGGGGGSGPVPQRFIGKPGTELSPLSSKPKAKRRPADGDEEEEEIDIHALATIETPNAGQEDIELDPELAALIDMSDDDVEPAEGAEAAASGDASTPEAAAAPAAEAKPAGPNDDFLSLFEETETIDTVPTALRDAVPPATMAELQEASRSLRAILGLPPVESDPPNQNAA